MFISTHGQGRSETEVLPSTRYTRLSESQIECKLYFQEVRAAENGICGNRRQISVAAHQNIRLKRLLEQHGKSPDDKLPEETSEQLLQYDQAIDELTHRLNETEAENEDMKGRFACFELRNCSQN